MEPPCGDCCVELDEHYVVYYNLFSLVRNQVIVSPMGDLIDLDYRAVLDVVKLYVAAEMVKETFEHILECFSIEREITK